tara:strand:- start:232 stop:351 length:120 start_codon:yes stop_codon:yes gene_type:complete
VAVAAAPAVLVKLDRLTQDVVMVVLVFRYLLPSVIHSLL